MNQHNPHVKARPTVYRGTQMRSRLEAQFAAHLDDMKREWRYEPMCFADESGQYLPDFAVTVGGVNCYIEVKPTRELAEEWLGNQMRRIWASEPDAVLIATWYDNEFAEYRQDHWRVLTATRPVAWWEMLLKIDHKMEFRGNGFATFYSDDYISPVGYTSRTVFHSYPKHSFDVIYRTQQRNCDITLPAPMPAVPAELRPVDDEWHYICPDVVDNWIAPHFIYVDSDGVLGDTYQGNSLTLGAVAWFTIELSHPSSDRWMRAK